MDYEILKEHPHLPKKGEIVSSSELLIIFTSTGIVTLIEDETIKEFSEEASNSGIKKLIIGNIKDLVSSFLYYDRKEDEELRMNYIENAIKNQIITFQEIIDIFENELWEALTDLQVNQ